jgi:S1-C subfamily serine protease
MTTAAALLAAVISTTAAPKMSAVERKLVAVVGPQIVKADATHYAIQLTGFVQLVKLGQILIKPLEIRRGQGVTMVVIPDGIFGRLGFETGDLVTSVNRVDATTMPVVDLFVRAKPGDRFVVRLWRARKLVKLEIRLT